MNLYKATLFLGSALTARAAVDKDEIKALPGWDKPLPTKVCGVDGSPGVPEPFFPLFLLMAATALPLRVPFTCH